MARGRIAEDDAGISLGPSQLANASHLPAALVGDSPQLRGVLDRVAELARSDAPVLLVGERDTGKRELARMIHQMSGRSESPLTAIDCGSQTAELQRVLMERHESASSSPPAAGTLVIAEFECLEPALCEHAIEALAQRAAAGEAAAGPRLIVIVATAYGQDQSALVARLSETLGVQAVHMPPLRERRTDVPVLADYFVEAANRKLGRRVSAHPLLAALTSYSWPGNLKELETRVATYVTNAPPEFDTAPQNAFAVPVDRLQVTLILPDGTRHEVRLPRGPGRPLEELFEDKEPFLAVQQGTQTRIYARTALACIVAPNTEPPQDEALPQRTRAIRVLLRGGVTLEGELRYVPVEGRTRVTDVLNEHSPSFALHSGELVQLIAKAHVLCVEEC